MKRIASVLLASFLIASAFAGCGGGSSPQTPASSDSSTASTEATGGEKSEIIVSLWDYSNTEYYKTQIAAFEEKYPQYAIKVLEAPANEYDDKIQIMLSGGDNVDVVYTKGTVALSALIQKGQVLALDDYIAASDIDPNAFSGLIKHLSLDGKIYAVPYRKDNNMIYYNKRLFDNAGVEYPKDGMTMDEYRALAKKLTSGEGAEKVYGAHVHTWPSNVYQYARRTGEYDPIGGKVAVLKPYYEVILAMQNEDKTIMDYASLKAGNIHYSGVFYNEQVAMLQIGTWFTNMLVEKTLDGTIDFEWGVCSLPDLKGTGNTIGVGGVTPVSINAKAKNPEGAWDFINYVCGKEGATILAGTGILPGYTDDNVVSQITKLTSVPESMGQYLVLDKITVEQAMHPKGREIDKILDEQHGLIMTGGATIDDGLAELQQRIDEVLAG